MRLLKRLLHRAGKVEPRETTSDTVQTEAEEDAARKYWKGEVSADKKRRGKPDKHPR